MRNDILFFPIITSTEDELGQIEEIEEYSRKAFCERRSIPQNEFFQAGLSGIKASQILIVDILDYQDEVKVKYRNKIYRIYRTYEKSDEEIELYCEVRADG
ncbi:phage head closure protein [Heyndrickxia sp. FSL K6-6286]|uniref:phage head closure protein n=1 Tax=Heyndrickxia sp. FSL K6-6286 TaxID=2921510 RepID=UPI00315A3530